MRIFNSVLDDDCEFFNGKAHEKDINDNGDFIVVNSKFISSNAQVSKHSAKQMFPLIANDIVMVMSDVPNGKALAKCRIIDKDNKYTLNQRICAIRTKEYHTKFLYYQLNRHPFLLSFNNGENQTNLRKGDILKIPLWKPSIHIQKQIAETLDETLTKISFAKTNIETNLSNINELFHSRLNEIYLQKGKDWQEKKLIDVCEIKPQKKLAKTKLKETDHVSFVPMNYLGVNEMYFGSNETKPLKEVYKGYVYFEDGDVILAKITPCFENGKLGIARNLKNKVGFGSSEYVVYRPNDDLIKAEFLYFFLNRQSFRSKGKSLMTGAVGHKRIQPSFYENETLLLPSIKQQEEICKEIISLKLDLDELEHNYQKQLLELDELSRSIIENAFAGELTNKINEA